MRWLRWARRPRWYELIPELALAGGLTYFLVDQTDAATSAFKSGRAITLMVIVAALWIAARIVLLRFAPWPLARVVVFGAGAAAILAIVVIPAYRDKTVIEQFPTAEAPSTGEVSMPKPEVPPAQPIAERVGALHGIDHHASGTVVVYRQPDGHHVVGLEDFDIQPGPHYVLYVVPRADSHSKDGGTRLDDLRGNRGTQYYDVPVGTDLGSGEWTVLVWCQTFAVPVANATPTMSA
jgi:hypothetical protein